MPTSILGEADGLADRAEAPGRASPMPSRPAPAPACPSRGFAHVGRILGAVRGDCPARTACGHTWS
jgi:hypothetical protein